jgi:hypothetical protein
MPRVQRIYALEHLIGELQNYGRKEGAAWTDVTNSKSETATIHIEDTWEKLTCLQRETA